ncbi:NADH-quinone oxidoreductase subunit NuoK [Krasilnikovia sp. MM14-A1004]|uniref:NADH-quinone oxidoreductase subunit NuoK n=1 Tax=Krasilnikovia sp. MM14-A1004 TaxID=3373541 RepID=UPI00399CD276
MHAVIPMVTAGLLFGLGVYGVLRRRNTILVLMAVELMLNAVNLVFVTADATISATLGGAVHAGSVFALFVIVLAAAEIGVGLAIVLQFYRMRANVVVDEVALDPAPPEPAQPEPTESDTARETEPVPAGAAATLGADPAAGTENEAG